VPFKRVKVFMGDTANSVNQGGASGSTGIQYGGKQMRMAAAEARRVLVEMAAGLLSTPVEQLVVNGGVVSSRADATKQISYEQMIGGKYFNVQTRLEQAVRQHALCARQGATKKSERTQDRRSADQARRRCTKGFRARGLCDRRESARHGARAHDPPGRRRRCAGESR
ncbi:MAG: molybdopterin cofactor-binding domain-containing protein, partial [Pseudolabrys sp.]